MRSTSAPTAFRVGVRRSEKRKIWSEESMLGAMKAVAQGLPMYKASRDYGVPKSTLHDRVSGKVVHGVNPGPKPCLSRGEEKELDSYLKHCAKVGYGKHFFVLLNQLLLTEVSSDQVVLVTDGGIVSWNVNQTCR